MLKYTNTYQGKKRCYLRCAGCSQGLCSSHAIRLDRVEEQVRLRLESYFTRWGKNADFLLRQASDQETEKYHKELERIQGEIGRRTKALQGLYLDKIQGIITPEQFMEWNKTYQEEQQAFKLRAARLEQAMKQASPVICQEALQIKSLPRALAVLAIQMVEIGEQDKNTGRQIIRITWNF